MDESQKRRLEQDIKRAHDVNRGLLGTNADARLSAVYAAHGVPSPPRSDGSVPARPDASVNDELTKLGLPIEHLDVAQIPVALFTSMLSYAIRRWNLPREVAHAYLAEISTFVMWAPYWIELPPGDTPPNPLANQIARVTRVALNEIWDIMLWLDEEYVNLNLSMTRDDEGRVSDVDNRKLEPLFERARVKALAIITFLINVVYDAADKRQKAAPTSAAVPATPSPSATSPTPPAPPPTPSR